MNHHAQLNCLHSVLILAATNAHAIDLQPGEVRAPEPDASAVQLTTSYSERGDHYLNGRKQQGTAGIVSAQYQVRLAHAFELNSHTSVFYLQVPIGYIHPTGTLSALDGDTGPGDPTLALAIWPYANQETQTYFALAGYLVIPLGSYDNKRNFNMGQHRYQTAFQAGYQSQLTDKLQWMAALDALWSGANNNFGISHASLKQQPLYSGQTVLRYDITPEYAVAATYFYSAGGGTSVNGIASDDVTRLQRYQLSGIASHPFGRITLQYGGDLRIENGYIERQRLILRYTKLF